MVLVRRSMRLVDEPLCELLAQLLLPVRDMRNGINPALYGLFGCVFYASFAMRYHCDRDMFSSRHAAATDRLPVATRAA